MSRNSTRRSHPGLGASGAIQKGRGAGERIVRRAPLGD
jgi:hypothetical protein